ncbi:uncharacterized protein J3R85_007864 [Psidium guajava]|nr:uncharacterized protein J3R85_007864 [Psidium guajava]
MEGRARMVEPALTARPVEELEARKHAAVPSRPVIEDVQHEALRQAEAQQREGRVGRPAAVVGART